MAGYEHVKVEHVTLTDFDGQFTDKLHQVDLSVLEEYFNHFAIFGERAGRCRCGRVLGFPGSVENVMGIATFTWGIQNGEGYCYGCGWPGRAYHKVKLPWYGALSFAIALPYHPDEVQKL